MEEVEGKDKGGFGGGSFAVVTCLLLPPGCRRPAHPLVGSTSTSSDGMPSGWRGKGLPIVWKSVWKYLEL